jgi:hypothetical protein
MQTNLTVASSKKMSENTTHFLQSLSLWSESIPTERPPLVGEVIDNFFADRGCHMVSVTDPHGRIHGFLDRSCYFSIK